MAITRFLRRRRPGTPARVLVELSADNVDVPLPTDGATDLTVLVRPAQSLARTLATLELVDRPPGSVLAFVAAESAVVPVARELLAERWGLPTEAVIVKGYWRQN